MRSTVRAEITLSLPLNNKFCFQYRVTVYNILEEGGNVPCEVRKTNQ